jgi:DNA repair exonuclease SbcCD nuclease subunit
MNKKSLNIAVISDIHLGHRKTRTKDIINGLYKAFPDNEETGELDIIFLAGDVFDRLLSLPEDDVTTIYIWIVSFVKMCAKRDIMIRILEGTPSHDWKQSYVFCTLAGFTQTPVYLEYVDTLRIEYIEEFDINILYVPDEWDITPERTLEQVHSLLAAKGLEKVDFAIMHGQFEFQLPSFLNSKIPRHNSAAYLDIVKEYIFIGHVHTHSTLDRIIAQGSFDRLAHGEENPKGHVRAVITPNSREFSFIENKLAQVYKSITLDSLDIKQSLDFISKEIDILPAESRVRIIAPADHPVFSDMNVLVRLSPTINWSKKPINEQVLPNQQEDETVYNAAITISKENVVDLLMACIKKSCSDTDIINLSNKLLLETIQVK